MRIFWIAGLLLWKRLAGNRFITLRVLYGANKGLKFSFGRNSDNDLILGNWEKTMQDVFTSFLHEGDVVYDLGAHQGFLTLLASRLVGSRGQVYAFEPLPSNFHLLARNMDHNRPDNCRIFEYAVSDKTGTVKFTTSHASVSNTYIENSPTFHDSQLAEVESVALDDLIVTESLRPPTFIKIDVEGAELDVLKGAKTIIQQANPLIYLETHNVHNPGVDSRAIEFLKSLGYRIQSVIFQDPNQQINAYLLSKS